MKRRRLKLEGRSVVYHVFSRSVNGEKVFYAKARAVFRKQLHVLAAFCGVKVLTFAVMENHFHILVEVPKWEEPSREEMLRRARVLYGESREARLRAELAGKDPVKRHEAAETKPGKPAVSPERSEAVLGRGGRLTLAEALRRRVPWFEDGAVLGGRAFVEGLGETFRESLGRKRKAKAKVVPEAYGEGLAALRTPRKRSR